MLLSRVVEYIKVVEQMLLHVIFFCVIELYIVDTVHDERYHQHFTDLGLISKLLNCRYIF